MSATDNKVSTSINNFDCIRKTVFFILSQKRSRKYFTPMQRSILLAVFEEEKYIDRPTCENLADLLHMSDKQVLQWFQTARRKLRKDVSIKIATQRNLSEFLNFKTEENQNIFVWPTIQSRTFLDLSDLLAIKHCYRNCAHLTDFSVRAVVAGEMVTTTTTLPPLSMSVGHIADSYSDNPIVKANNINVDPGCCDFNQCIWNILAIPSVLD